MNSRITLRSEARRVLSERRNTIGCSTIASKKRTNRNAPPSTIGTV